MMSTATTAAIADAGATDEPADDGPQNPGGGAATPRCHAVILPDEAPDGRPVYLCGDDQDAFLNDLHARLEKIRRGWAFIFIDGHLWRLSGPVIQHLLRAPDGRTVALSGSGEDVRRDDGYFDLGNRPDGRRW